MGQVGPRFESVYHQKAKGESPEPVKISHPHIVCTSTLGCTFATERFKVMHKVMVMVQYAVPPARGIKKRAGEGRATSLRSPP